MDTIFTGDSYKSPAKSKKSFYDFLFLGSRWGLYVQFFIDIVLHYKKEALKGIYNTARWAHSSNHTQRIVEKFGGKFSISGMDNLKNSEKPVVFVANHMSALETFILPGIIAPHMDVTFVVKESLVNGNYFGHIMRSRDPITVSRENARKDLEKVLTEGQRILGEGRSIIIFPQSTRSAEFNPEKFNSLGVKLAIRAGVPVIPIALKTDFWCDSKIIHGFGPLKRKKKIHFEVGQPIKPAGRGKIEHQQVVDFIKGCLSKWKKQDDQN